MSDDEPDPIVTRSITIAELMDADGDRYITIDTEGSMPLCDILGMLTWALETYKADVAIEWASDATDDE